MKRQRGQTLVEFALILPLMALFIFGMIYGGAMFMQYLNFSNEARQIAREVSVLENVKNREDIITKYGQETELSRFYTAVRKIYFVDKDNNIVKNDAGNPVYNSDAVDVMVEVTFTRDNKDLPWILYKVGFPPENINPIIYRMRLEQKPTQETSSEESSDS